MVTAAWDTSTLTVLADSASGLACTNCCGGVSCVDGFPATIQADVSDVDILDFGCTGVASTVNESNITLTLNGPGAVYRGTTTGGITIDARPFCIEDLVAIECVSMYAGSGGSRTIYFFNQVQILLPIYQLPVTFENFFTNGVPPLARCNELEDFGTCAEDIGFITWTIRGEFGEVSLYGS